MSQCRAGLRHLHEGQQAVLHARAATGGDANERQLLFDANLHTAHKTLADNRPHRSAKKAELECRSNERYRLDAALHHNQSVSLIRFLAGFLEPFNIAAAVAKLEGIYRQNLGTDFKSPFRIQQKVEPVTRGQAVMMTALRADEQVFFKVSSI